MKTTVNISLIVVFAMLIVVSVNSQSYIKKVFAFSVLPPEINSARMYSGAGSGPLSLSVLTPQTSNNQAFASSANPNTGFFNSGTGNIGFFNHGNPLANSGNPNTGFFGVTASQEDFRG